MTEAHGGPSSGGDKEISRAGDNAVDRDADRMSATRAATIDESVRDTSVETLFDELKAESEADGPTAYEDASAESILDDADGHEHEQFADGEEAIAAGDEVNGMLIPDRTDGEEFRWIETESAESASEPADGSAGEIENELFSEGGDLFAETDGDDTDAAAEGRDDSTAFPSTTPPQRAVDTDDSTGGEGGSSESLLTRLLSFVGLR